MKERVRISMTIRVRMIQNVSKNDNKNNKNKNKKNNENKKNENKNNNKNNSMKDSSAAAVSPLEPHNL